MFYFDLLSAAWDMGGFVGWLFIADLLIMPVLLTLFALASLIESIVWRLSHVG